MPRTKRVGIRISGGAACGSGAEKRKQKRSGACRDVQSEQQPHENGSFCGGNSRKMRSDRGHEPSGAPGQKYQTDTGEERAEQHPGRLLKADERGADYDCGEAKNAHEQGAREHKNADFRNLGRGATAFEYLMTMSVEPMEHGSMNPSRPSPTGRTTTVNRSSSLMGRRPLHGNRVFRSAR